MWPGSDSLTNGRARARQASTAVQGYGSSSSSVLSKVLRRSTSIAIGSTDLLPLVNEIELHTSVGAFGVAQCIALQSSSCITNSPTIGIRFTPDELQILDALAAKDERNRSEVVRRAVRAYAESLGVKEKLKKKDARHAEGRLGKRGPTGATRFGLARSPDRPRNSSARSWNVPTRLLRCTP